MLKENDEAYQHFFPNGKVPQEGELFIQKDFAWSFELIAEEGPDAFYKSEIADKVITSLEKHGGLLTCNDFSVYEAKWDTPFNSEYLDKFFTDKSVMHIDPEWFVKSGLAKELADKINFDAVVDDEELPRFKTVAIQPICQVLMGKAMPVH